MNETKAILENITRLIATSERLVSLIDGIMTRLAKIESLVTPDEGTEWVEELRAELKSKVYSAAEEQGNKEISAMFVDERGPQYRIFDSNITDQDIADGLNDTERLPANDNEHDRWFCVGNFIVLRKQDGIPRIIAERVQLISFGRG